MSRTSQHDAETATHPPTIPAALMRAAERWPDTEAYVEGDRRVTFREFRAAALEIARGLLAKEVQLGDRVVIWAPNSIEFAIAAMGVYCAGGAVVPLNTRFTAYEAQSLIRQAKARVVFAFERFLDRDYLNSLREFGLLAELDAAISLRGDTPEGCLSLGDLVTLGEGVDEQTVLDREADLDPDANSDILFTSGTTGVPKGAMLRHEASCRGYTEYGRSLGLQVGDRVVGVAPFFHCFGLKGLILTATLCGATILPLSTFEVTQLAGVIEKEAATVLLGAPPIFQALLDDPRIDRNRLSSLRVAGPGAMGAATKFYTRLRDELGFSAFSPGYALTESHAIACRTYWFDDFETVSTTSGRPVPGIELQIVDEENAPVPDGTDGEIVIRGYTVMSGYFEDPVATAATIVDGWLHTGDIGHLDEQGRIHVTDRKKDMFLVGGYSTYPAEIEFVLSSFPGISAVAVIGVPDSRLGEVGKAYVVPVGAGTVEITELEAFARARLANYKIPRHWEVVNELPRNASGKVQKFVLRENLSPSAKQQQQKAGTP